MSETNNGSRRPLDGIRVIAIEQFTAGPYGSQMLSDFGAEVIRIEPPGKGEGGRQAPPSKTNEHGTVNYSLLRMGRNKKCLSLNFQDPRGQEIFRWLIPQIDVLWENLRPGSLDKVGLGYDRLRELNPRLIYASISGFGHRDIYQSPFVDRVSFDIIGQAMGGLMMRPGKPGDPPYYLGFPLGDQYPGVLAAYGVLLAIIHRQQTGVGQHIDVSMVDAATSLNELALGVYGFTGQDNPRGLIGTAGPYGSFKASDGYVVIAVHGDAIWKRFCEAFGFADWLQVPELQSGWQRCERQETVLRPRIEEWTSSRTRADIVAFCAQNGIPSAPVQEVADIHASAHTAARNMLLEIDDPVSGPVKVAGQPIKMSNIPEPDTKRPPRLGEHNAEILGGLLGLAPAEIEELTRAGVL